MSTLNVTERRDLEKLLRMPGGYVSDFSNRTFGELFSEKANVDIHSERYTTDGSSKANKLRTFWKIEPDAQVGEVLAALIEEEFSIIPSPTPQDISLHQRCKEIANRLLAGSGPSLEPLKAHADLLDANHLAEQIRRLEKSVEADPSLAIGTAKELIETCCKTILAERGKPVGGTPDVSNLTKATLKELKLVPEGVPDSARGVDVIKRLLISLGSMGNTLAELRGLYGTGHGKHGRRTGLTTRHAKLAVGAAATLSVFLFETHQETK